MARKRQRISVDRNAKKEKHHIVEYGEIHPLGDKVEEIHFAVKPVSKKIKIKEAPNEIVSEQKHEEDLKQNSYSELLSVFGGVKCMVDTSDHSEDGGHQSTNKIDSNCSDDSVFSDTNSLNYSVNEDPDEEKLELEESDYFQSHFEKDVEEESIKIVQQQDNLIQNTYMWSELGRINLTSFQETNLKEIKFLREVFIKESLLKNMKLNNMLERDQDELKPTTLHRELFSIIGRYVDLYYPNRTFGNGEIIRFVYTVHAVNHVLKTSKIIMHNSKLSKANKNLDVEFRDHGLTRPKVLIVVPFRESVLRIVNIIENLLIANNKANVQNKKRFKDEFSLGKEAEEKYKKKKISRPDDFEAMFAGNIDDAFRIGLSIKKNSMRLFVDFYSSDIIIASPLGLRTIIGGKGDKERDFDFLSSIEILIFDQAEVFTMQNWDHVLHLMDHMHQQPKDSHGLDFSRVRMWCLNGWSKYYRQTILFSSVILPQVTALFNQHCQNYSGKARVCRHDVDGCINQVIIHAPHVFHRFEVKAVVDVADERFNFFVSKILPQFKETNMFHTLIFIPSYFDFLRVRNYMKRDDMSITQICEYTKDAKISRARNLFVHKKRRFLLYTERFHFYRRYHIKGIRHVIFYELPYNPHFYRELCNFIKTDDSGERSDVTCTALYNKYDVHQLLEVVGTERATAMINSEKKSHMFVTGD